MSKMDDMRALREARYAASTPRAPRARAVPAAPAAQASTPVRARKTAVPATSSDDLCGHRAISGRTCTREKGHAAKSHRYA